MPQALQSPVSSRLGGAWAWSTVLVVFSVVLWTATGVALITSLALAALVLWQSLAGVVMWRSIRPAATWLELAGAGLAIGTVFASLAGLLTATVGAGPFGALVPSLIALAYAGLARHRSRTSQHGTQEVTPNSVDRVTAVGFVAALITGGAVLLNSLRSYPLNWIVSWSGYHPDMPFFEALANSLARFGALESPFILDGIVRYHWLSYAWTGQLSILTNADPFVGITRVLPVVALIGSAAIVVSWTRRLSAASWTPTLAGLLLTLGGFVGAVFGGVLTMDSPSQSMAVLWLLAFALLIVDLTIKRSVTALSIGLLALITLAMTGGKVSAAAPAVAGALLMTAVALLRHTITAARAALLAGATVLGAITGFVLFLAGSLGGGGLTMGALIERSSSQQGLNPLDGDRGVILGTLILVLAVLPRWAGIGWLMIDRSWRWRPETWLSIGMGLSSVLALIAFNSFNEIWFSSTVSGPLAVTTSVGAGLAFAAIPRRPRVSTRALLISSIGSALVVYIAIWLLWATGASGGNLFVGTWRWLGPLIAWIGAGLLGAAVATWATGRPTLRASIAGAVIILIFLSVPGRILGAGTGQVGVLTNGIRSEWFILGDTQYAQGIDTDPITDWTSEKMAAGDWLRTNADPTDILATNLTVGPFVAGITHLPTYVSAVGYQSPYGPPELGPELLANEAEVWRFINEPDAQSVQPLCAGKVRWLWIDPTRTDQASWSPFAEIAYQNSEVVIARIAPDACSNK